MRVFLCLFFLLASSFPSGRSAAPSSWSGPTLLLEAALLVPLALHFLPGPGHSPALPLPPRVDSTVCFLFVLICSALAGHVRAHRVFVLRWLITAPGLAGGQRTALISPESRRIWGLKPVLNSMSFSQSGPLIPAACCPQSPRENLLPSPIC